MTVFMNDYEARLAAEKKLREVEDKLLKAEEWIKQQQKQIAYLKNALAIIVKQGKQSTPLEIAAAALGYSV